MKQRHYWIGLVALLLCNTVISPVIWHSVLNNAPAARNGSGTYSTINTFSAGDTISSSKINQNFSDVGTELTNSVAADGQTSMTGPLKASNGTAAAPSVTFASDTDTGFYRIGANNMGLSIGGTKLVDYSSTGAAITGNFSATGTLSDGNGSTVPAGTVLPYAGGTAPTGYLFAYGQCVSRTTYATLFAVLSTTYDNACAGTDFGIPDLRGRAPFGDDNMGGSAASRITSAATSCAGDTVGTACGAQTVTVAQANLPSYTLPNTLSINDAGVGSGTFQGVVGTNAGGALLLSAASGASATAHALTITGSVTSGGSGTALNKLPPALILSMIIKY